MGPVATKVISLLKQKRHGEGAMPIYRIEQYELYSSAYRIEANSEAEAIGKLLAGEAKPLDHSLTFIEVAEDFGMPAEEFRDLTESLESIAVSCTDVIPSIRSIEIIPEQA